MAGPACPRGVEVSTSPAVVANVLSGRGVGSRLPRAYRVPWGGYPAPFHDGVELRLGGSGSEDVRPSRLRADWRNRRRRCPSIVRQHAHPVRRPPQMPSSRCRFGQALLFDRRSLIQGSLLRLVLRKWQVRETTRRAAPSLHPCRFGHFRSSSWCAREACCRQADSSAPIGRAGKTGGEPKDVRQLPESRQRPTDRSDCVE